MRLALATGTLPAKLLAAAVAASFCFTASVADAKPRKQAKAKSTSSQSAKNTSKNTQKSASRDDDDNSGWRRGQSAIIIDGNTGKVLYEDNPDSLRHPASVTKVMTLYMLFEQLELGRLKLDSELPVSGRAASMSPSKLNLRPGSTIEVEDAIKAVVTRSANDVAVVIAEAIGGDESSFAAMMTRKARALGMDNTQFRNASGLPNKGQLTTARDLATLGLAIQDRFPRYYKYFSTRTFYYRGEAIANHNRMFGRLEGVDGIKTGYTNASGFNLLTSIHNDDKFIIGVVMGGSSGASRDARMANLVNSSIGRAYAGRRTAPKVTEVAEADPAPSQAAAPIPAPRREAAAPSPVAPLPAPQRMAYAADPVTTAAIPPRGPSAGSAEPIKPVAVKTTAISRPATQPLPAPTFSGGPTPPAVLAPMAAAPLVPAAVAQAPVAPVPLAPAPVAAAPQHTLQAQALAMQPVSQQPVRTASAGPVALPAAMPAATHPEAPAASRRPGWMIQIGAFGGEKEAKSHLDLAQSKAKSLLGDAEPYVEKATKGSSDIYRARFAGLNEKGAKEACRLLQRNDFACMTLRN